MKTLVLLDSNAIVHRAYHALPKNLSNSKGELTNVTYGFALALIKVLEELHPTHIAAAFDLGGPTFRHLEYVEYKAKRVKADQELYDQIPRVKEMLEAFKIPIFAVEGFEADDILGTIVEKMKEKDLMVYIASGDKDVYQLLNGHVKVLMLKRGFSEAEIFDHKHLKKFYNLDPSDFIDLKALAGDPSDNIPGIPGVGPKGATDLIIKFDTLGNLYDSIESHSERSEESSNAFDTAAEGGLDPSASPQDDKKKREDDGKIQELAKKLEIKPRILQLLIEHKDQAFQSQRLATIRRDVPIKFSLEDCKWGQYDREKLRKLFEELQFKSLLDRFSKGEESPSSQKSIKSIKSENENQITAEQKKKDAQLKLEL